MIAVSVRRRTMVVGHALGLDADRLANLLVPGKSVIMVRTVRRGAHTGAKNEGLARRGRALDCGCPDATNRKFMLSRPQPYKSYRPMRADLACAADRCEMHGKWPHVLVAL